MGIIYLNTLNTAKKTGTFMPWAEGIDSAGIGTYTTQTGSYIKDGEIVKFNLGLAWTAHTGTGVISIKGLPYSAKAITGVLYCPTLYVHNLTFSGQLTAYIQGTSVELRVMSTGSVSSGIAMDTAATIYLDGSYVTNTV